MVSKPSKFLQIDGQQPGDPLEGATTASGNNMGHALQPFEYAGGEGTRRNSAAGQGLA